MKLYDTLRKALIPFVPQRSGEVSLYVCGVTVYDYCHIGHARVYLFFDTLVRFFQSQNFKVHYVRNITDVDDKIIHKATQENKDLTSITNEFIQAMHEDFKSLGIQLPTHEPKATEMIPEMIEMIVQLIDKGLAYPASNGDVYYKVEAFEPYGELSARALDELRTGVRIDVNQAKQNPLDFVLWKSAKPEEPSWPSPWGYGRPGWHIECSAMSLKSLGVTLDIHGGGHDLIFPHHENERAQSEGVSEKTFVHYWMHVGHVQHDKQKMSKSLGNFLTIRDFLKRYDAEVLRYFALSSHYRSPVDFSFDQADMAKRSLQRLYQTLWGFDLKDISLPVESSPFAQKFIACMKDDFNTPEAIAVLFELSHEIHRLKTARKIDEAKQNAFILKQLAGILGFLEKDPKIYLQNLEGKALSRSELESMIQSRAVAREQKQWDEADRIRKILIEQGIALEDTSDGTQWHVIP